MLNENIKKGIVNKLDKFYIGDTLSDISVIVDFIEARNFIIDSKLKNTVLTRYGYYYIFFDKAKSKFILTDDINKTNKKKLISKHEYLPKVDLLVNTIVDTFKTKKVKKGMLDKFEKFYLYKYEMLSTHHAFFEKLKKIGLTINNKLEYPNNSLYTSMYYFYNSEFDYIEVIKNPPNLAKKRPTNSLVAFMSYIDLCKKPNKDKLKNRFYKKLENVK